MVKFKNQFLAIIFTFWKILDHSEWVRDYMMGVVKLLSQLEPQFGSFINIPKKYNQKVTK